MSGVSRPLARAAILFGLAIVALLMLRHSLADVIRPLDAELALRIDPANAQAQASVAELLLRADPSPAHRARAERLARSALAREPVLPDAVRMLAIARDLAGDEAGARRLMAYSERISRRDLPSQIWFIEDAVNRNDIPAALYHYDIALRGTEAAKPILFPVLVSATAQPEVVDGLIPTLAARPLWAIPFLLQASRDGPDLNGLAHLLTALARRGYDVPEEAVSVATARLVAAGRYALAWQVYAASRPGVAPVLRDANFAAAGSETTPFDWSLTNGNGVSAEPRSYGRDGRLAYAAATGAGGVVARQLLLLPPGPLLVRARIFTETAVPIVRLTCAGGPVIGTIGSGARTGGLAGHLVIPAVCEAQWLEIIVSGGDDPAGVSGEIGALRVTSQAGTKPL